MSMLEMSMLENQDLDKDLEKVVAIESYAPEEIFAVQKPQQQQQQRGFEPPLQSLDKMFRMFYETKPYENHKAELEIRFGTKGIRPLTKNDYDNVIKKLKSSGFICDNPNGENSLRIQSMFLDNQVKNFIKLTKVSLQNFRCCL